jgi:ribosome recycling factor
MSSLSERMGKTIESTKKHFATIRTGRANPDILSFVQVEYYGTKVPLQQLASISVPENTMLVLNVFDKSAVKDIERAIMVSDLNLNPQTDGSIIRLRFPELTEERRKEFVKLVKKQAEEGKVAIRNIRRDEIEELKKMEKNKEISEDDLKSEQEEVQKQTDKYSKRIDEIANEKEEEILKI